MGPNKSLVNEDLAQDQFCNLLPTCYKQLGLNSEGANKMHISSKTPEHFGWHALLWTSTHGTGKVCSTNSSASNDVPVPHVSHLKEESGRVSEEGAAVGAG